MGVSVEPLPDYYLVDESCFMLLLGLENYGMAYALVVMMILLGLVAICIPRPRKKFQVAETTKKIKRKRPKTP